MRSDHDSPWPPAPGIPGQLLTWPSSAGAMAHANHIAQLATMQADAAAGQSTHGRNLFHAMDQVRTAAIRGTTATPPRVPAEEAILSVSSVSDLEISAQIAFRQAVVVRSSSLAGRAVKLGNQRGAKGRTREPTRARRQEHGLAARGW